MSTLVAWVCPWCSGCGWTGCRNDCALLGHAVSGILWLSPVAGGQGGRSHPDAQVGSADPTLLFEERGGGWELDKLALVSASPAKPGTRPCTQQQGMAAPRAHTHTQEVRSLALSLSRSLALSLSRSLALSLSRSLALSIRCARCIGWLRLLFPTGLSTNSRKLASHCLMIERVWSNQQTTLKNDK